MSNNFEVQTNEYLQQCNPKDVLSFKGDKWIDIKKIQEIIFSSFVVSGTKSLVEHIVKYSDFKNKDRVKSWFHEGQDCEILRAGSDGWQKGKLKINITLEFIPDEPEIEKSPLDDIRQADINT